jgi:hypothetical protein
MIAAFLALTFSLFHISTTTAQKPENNSPLRAEIEKLKTTESRLAAEINKIQNELNYVRQQIAALESKVAQEALKSVDFVEARMGTSWRKTFPVFDKQNSGLYELGKEIGYLEADSPVQIVGYAMKGKYDISPSYKIKFKDGFGYISIYSVADTPLLAAMRQPYKQQEEAQMLAHVLAQAEEERQSRAKAEEAIAERRERLLAQYGADATARILANRYWIGMADSMALESRGSPETVNRTVTANGTHEQWVYKDMYLYFENGILTSYQDRR